MRIAIMQPYLFPYIGYWQLVEASDVFVVFDDVNYIKRGWINRNRIRNVQGAIESIVMPVIKASQNRLICEHEICDKEKNASKLLKTIELNYKKAPYYSKVFPHLESIMKYEDCNIANFLANQIKCIADYLEMDTEILRSSRMKNRKELHSQEKIIDICKLLGADEYINAIGGCELYDTQHFFDEGIELMFLISESRAYNQRFDDFVPGLSILDVLMHNCKSDIKSMLEQYKLVAKAEAQAYLK